VDCKGYSAAFFASSELNERVPYTLTDLEMTGFSQNIASSMAIPYGVRVDLYSGDGFIDDVITIDGPFYLDDTLRHACVSIANSFNDQTSSLEVQRTAALGSSAKSYWRSITQTETLSFTVSYGVRLTDHQGEKTTKENALSYEMKAGIKFGDAKIEKDYKDVIALDTERTFTYDASVKYTITCSASVMKPGVGLWQWVTESSDGQVSVLT